MRRWHGWCGLARHMCSAAAEDMPLIALTGASIRPHLKPGSADTRRDPMGARFGPGLTCVDWSIRDGEHWLVMGGNGSGKTTLASALHGGAAVLRGTLARRADCPPASVSVVSFAAQCDAVRRQRERIEELVFVAGDSGTADLEGEPAGEAIGSVRHAQPVGPPTCVCVRRRARTRTSTRTRTHPTQNDST